MPRADLKGLDEVQAKKADEIFVGLTFPEKTGPTPELIAELKKRAPAMLKWRDEKCNTEKMPSLRAVHFPHYTAFAACMVVGAEASLDIWNKRLLSGKNVATKEQENAKVLAKAQKLMAELKALGIDVNDPKMASLLSPKPSTEGVETTEPEAPEEPEVPEPAF